MQAEVVVDMRAIDSTKKALAKGLTKYDMHETRAAVQAGAQLIQATWMQYISGATVSYSKGDFTINSVTGTYRSAVMNGLRYPLGGDILSGGVVVQLSYADKLEKGFDPFDAKEGLLNSPKAKMTKTDDPNDEGEPYIDVPFRHKEKSIPRAIKTEVRKEGRALGTIRIGKGLPQAPFGIRTRLTPKKLHWSEGQLRIGLPYTWASGLLAGLTRIPAQGGGGTYMTFRRVSKKSSPDSWIHPGVEPRPVTAAIKENLSPVLKMMAADAIRRDVTNFMVRAGLTRGE